MVGRLSSVEIQTYSRQITLPDIGMEGQRKIREARVCIVGIGGIGSVMSLQLAGMGVGSLRIVDRDVVERINLHRQTIFDVKTLGMPKVEAARNRIRAVNPDVEVEPLSLSVDSRTAKRVVKETDIVLDGLDSLPPRRAINRASISLGIPYVYGAAIEMFGNVSTVIAGKTPCLECLFPKQTLHTTTCAAVGIHPSVVSMVASIEVSEAIKVITGAAPALTGKLLFVDLRNLTFETINVSRNQSCRTCGELEQPKK